MADVRPTRLDIGTVHALSNHLAVILGFADLALAETGPDDPRHSDLVEIRDAALAAAALLTHTRATEATPDDASPPNGERSS